MAKAACLARTERYSRGSGVVAYDTVRERELYRTVRCDPLKQVQTCAGRVVYERWSLGKRAIDGPTTGIAEPCRLTSRSRCQGHKRLSCCASKRSPGLQPKECSASRPCHKSYEKAYGNVPQPVGEQFPLLLLRWFAFRKLRYAYCVHRAIYPSSVYVPALTRVCMLCVVCDPFTRTLLLNRTEQRGSGTGRVA